MAGKLGGVREKNDYKKKFNNYYDQGYKFICWALEPFGGTNKPFKYILNSAMKSKALRTNQDVRMLINNIYIEFSILAKKLLINRLKNHILL
eukprot:50678_1